MRNKHRTSQENNIRPWYEYSASSPLSKTHPRIAKQWHPSKNGIRTPDEFTYGSQVKVWWKCLKDPTHEAWQAKVGDRTVSKSGCPACAGKKASKNYNLLTQFPEIASQWHPRKNGKAKPEQALPKSNKMVFWQCPVAVEHVWRATIGARTHSNSGCPFCAGQRVSRSNSLAQKFPEIAAQWHKQKNGKLTADDVTLGSSRIVWWKCPKGRDHIYQASVKARTKAGVSLGCPYCHGMKVSVTNSLVSLFPQVAAEWHEKKNRGLGLDVNSVTAKTPKQAWWRCSRNARHIWCARIQDRTQKRSGCPECRKRSSRN